MKMNDSNPSIDSCLSGLARKEQIPCPIEYLLAQALFNVSLSVLLNKVENED